MLTEQTSRDHFNNTMFNGFDFDTTMLRIGTMNMILHGVENPNMAIVIVCQKAKVELKHYYYPC